MIAVVGGGRMGRALAAGLSDAGERVQLWSRREAAGAVGDAVTGASTVLVAVPDDAIRDVARDLAATGTIESSQVVLHLSGLHDRRALEPLGPTGAALGSFHPLRSVTGTGSASERWQGGYAGVEGDERAVKTAERLGQRLGLTTFRLAGAAKPAYHAGAVFAANYVTALAAVAARLGQEAGIPSELAGRIYLPLLASAAANLAGATPEQALTGPVRRGDVATIRAHLEALHGTDRALYAALGLVTLDLARRAGLESEKGAAVERVLRDY